MKKILTAILSVSIIAASLAVPVLADYTAPEVSYDIIDVNEKFDNGTTTNTIDNTPAFQAAEEYQRPFTTTLDTTKEFYLGFDFRFDSADGQIDIKSNASSNNTGPMFTIAADSNLQTQTGSSSYQKLGVIEVGTWYTGEIEGKTGASQKDLTFRLYKYDGGTKTLVQETNSFNMRNLQSNNRVFNYMQVRNASVDNVLLVGKKPDTITLSSTADEINAGGDVAFEYTMTRLGDEVTKYTVEWSVYDETDTTPVEDENIVINQSGILSALVKAETQTVTVRATATFGEKELYGSKKIKINAVDTSGEKFDTVTVSGPESVKAGTSETYTFTATKGGEDVTSTLTSSDIQWSIYNDLGISKNNNIAMKIENGVLTIDESVIAQNITVRASSASGAIYGSAPVEITWADSQTESVLAYDACETDRTNATLTNSWDGSKAYATNNDVTYSVGDQTAYVITDVDIKFDTTDGHGLTILNNNGSENSNIRVHGGGLSQQTGNSNWTPILTADEFDPDAWYHIEFLYLGGSESGYNVYKYNDDGTKTLAKSMPNCNRRNDKNYGKITFTTGLAIDNLKIALASPNEVVLSSPGQYIFAGDTAQFSAAATRNGLTFAGVTGLEWSVLDEEGLPILDGTASISDSGLLTIDAMAEPQTITVRVSAATGDAYDEADITIQISEIFSVTNIGVNEAGTKIVKMYVDKNFAYNDDVVFILTIYDDTKLLKAVRVINTYGDRLSIGSNELTLDLDLPADFDPEKYSVQAMAWTSLS